MDRSLHRNPPLSYPDPDPNDPFAPLWVLRTRSSNPAIDLRGLYVSNNPLPSANPRRRSQSTPVEAVLFPPASVVTDTTSESGSSTDVDTIVAVPSKRAFHIPRFFARLSSKPLVAKKSISPPYVSSPLPDLAPLRRTVTYDNPSVAPASSIPRKQPATLKKPAPSVPSPLTSSPTTTTTSTAEPTWSHLPRRPHSSHTTPFLTVPHPHIYPPPDAEWHLPTPVQLAHAASLPVTAESGLRVPFASLFAAQRTIVVFVRHFWCPLCQDYMSTLVSTAQPHRMFASAEGMGTQPVRLVVISNGAHAFIPKYRQLFGLPFDMYTDPELRLYRALGMGRDGLASTREIGDDHVPLLDGGYVRHSLVGGIAMVVMRALRTGMPVWEKGGDIDQLGGEFVLGPGLQCSYAHRMQTPKGHAPIADVLKAAGVVVPAPPPTASTLQPVRRSNSTGAGPSHANSSMKEFGAGWGGARTSRTAAGKLEGRTHTRVSMSVSIPARPRDSTASLAPMTVEEEARWMEGRAEALERLRERKSARRGAFVGCFSAEEAMAAGASGEFCGTRGGTRTGVCSPVWEEDGEVLVIGFAEEGKAINDGNTEKLGEEEVVLCES